MRQSFQKPNLNKFTFVDVKVIKDQKNIVKNDVNEAELVKGSFNQEIGISSLKMKNNLVLRRDEKL